MSSPPATTAHVPEGRGSHRRGRRARGGGRGQPATGSASCTRWRWGCWLPRRGRCTSAAALLRRGAVARRHRRRRGGRAPRTPSPRRSSPASAWRRTSRSADLDNLQAGSGHRLAQGPRSPRRTRGQHRASLGRGGTARGHAVGRQHPAGHVGPGARERRHRSWWRPTPAGGSTSPRPGAPRSCCCSSVPQAPASS